MYGVVMCEKNKGGRPKITAESMNKNWQKDLLKAGAKGKSQTWVRAKVFKTPVSNDLWNRWVEEEPYFRETLNEAMSLSQVYWEDLSQDNASGENKAANSNSIMFNMTNRFKENWKHRQTVEQRTEHGLDVNDLDKLAETLSEYGIDMKDL